LRLLLLSALSGPTKKRQTYQRVRARMPVTRHSGARVLAPIGREWFGGRMLRGLPAIVDCCWHEKQASGGLPYYGSYFASRQSIVTAERIRAGATRTQPAKICLEEQHGCKHRSKNAEERHCFRFFTRSKQQQAVPALRIAARSYCSNRIEKIEKRK